MPHARSGGDALSSDRSPTPWPTPPNFHIFNPNRQIMPILLHFKKIVLVFFKVAYPHDSKLSALHFESLKFNISVHFPLVDKQLLRLQSQNENESM